MSNLINDPKRIAREKQFEKFLRRHSKLIYSTVWRYCKDKDIIADVIQYVLTRFHRAYINKSYDFEDYKVIFTISKNTTLLYLRKKEIKTIRLGGRGWNTIAAGATPLFRFSMLKTVLTEEQYELVYAVYVVGMTLKEYARIKNLKYSVVKSRHQKILKILRHHLEGFIG